MTSGLARRTLPILLLAGLGCDDGHAQQGFQDVIPADAMAFVGVDDVAALEQTFAASPMGKLWNDPECAPLRRELSLHAEEWSRDAQAALGIDPFVLPGMLSGPLAIALLDVPHKARGPGEPAGAGVDWDTGDGLPTPIAVCLLADVGARRDECRDLLGRLADRMTAQGCVLSSTERVGDDEVRALVEPPCEGQPPFEIRLAFHGNVLVAAARWGGLARDDMRRLLDGLNGGGGPSLADNPRFAASLAGSGATGPDVTASGPVSQRVWIDVHPLIPDDGGHVSNLLEKLGVRGLGSLSMAGRCSDGGSQFGVRLDWSGDGWIPRILQQVCRPGSFELMRCVPADCRAVQALHADWPGLFDVVVKTLIDSGAVSPGDFVEGLATAEETLGFNPRDDLLERLDGELVLVTSEVEFADAFPGMSADPQNFTLLLGVNDAPGLRELVSSLIGRTAFRAALRSTLSHGETIWTVPLIPGFSFSWAILDDVAIVSTSPQLVDDVLALRADPHRGSLATSPVFLEMTGKLRPGYGIFGYQDAAGAIRGLIRTLAALPELFGSEGRAGEPDWGAIAVEVEDGPTDDDAAADAADAEADVAADAADEPADAADAAALDDGEDDDGAGMGRPHIDFGAFDWILHLPLPDPSIAERYFHGASVSAMRVDAHGLQLESAGP